MLKNLALPSVRIAKLRARFGKGKKVEKDLSQGLYSHEATVPTTALATQPETLLKLSNIMIGVWLVRFWFPTQIPLSFSVIFSLWERLLIVVDAILRPAEQAEHWCSWVTLFRESSNVWFCWRYFNKFSIYLVRLYALTQAGIRTSKFLIYVKLKLLSVTVERLNYVAT